LARERRSPNAFVVFAIHTPTIPKRYPGERASFKGLDRQKALSLSCPRTDEHNRSKAVAFGTRERPARPGYPQSFDDDRIASSLCSS
jgi:hypothetical protein